MADDPTLRNAALRRKLQADLDARLDTLLAVVAALNALTALTNAEINQNPAAVIKDLARECKTITRQTVRLARLMVGAFDNADVGEDPPTP